MPESAPSTPPSVNRRHEPEMLSEYPSLMFEHSYLASPSSPIDQVHDELKHSQKRPRLTNDEETIPEEDDSTVRLTDSELEDPVSSNELIQTSCHLLTSVLTQLQTNLDKLKDSHQKALLRIQELEKKVSELSKNNKDS
ncbi:hypothetical protein POMI540_1505 [Schizosaccharomyces pombe]|uniref:Putative uncharacterized protein C15D4.08c n=1 Tax=Schizosaccharomyces pombe (strain 972 / ATCC 24843) TaxID=284812 RepID=YOG8_SCHPO|nr:uncharacterized protein SPBC15D4.08c [Schizosaccharomyces pombe]O74313.1 RecName: Full=Putative uncharacterized protein C15D4.08c [Schizosaccharomyces pombe 972h-]CAA20483.1 dubious [Schizosaccharomyces pombe]|eukprot:NP_596248.1 uncharacterized protein SPBC15D4.08c [Schizosaccharomyces pombe]